VLHEKYGWRFAIRSLLAGTLGIRIFAGILDTGED
jgi:hypothetical protein